MRRVAALLAVLAAGVPAVAYATAEPSVVQVSADDAWARGIRGAGVVVGVIDTGVKWDHPALKASYRGWDGVMASHAYNWHDAIHSAPANPCGANAIAPCDDQGHGTHVTGTVSGDDGGANQIGVAPAARWIACRAMDQGAGTPATYLECLNWMLAPTDLAGANPDPSRRPDVVLASWDCPDSEGCVDATLDAALQALRDAGVLVVANAGNGGSSCATAVDPPGSRASAMAIGAVNGSDTIAAFSARGPAPGGLLKPNAVAPGVSIRSATGAAGYGALSGTSSSAASAAGVAALLLSSNPALSRRPAELQRILQASAVGLTTAQGCGGDTTTVIPNHTYGYGRLDAIRAIDTPAEVIATPTPTPTPSPSPQPTPTPSVTPVPDQTAPAVTAVSLKPGAFRVGRRAKLRFTLSEAAKVTVTVQRRRGSRWVTVKGSIVRSLKAGRSTLTFTGRIGGRRLRRGRHRVVLVALDAARNRSAARRVSFRIR